MMRSYRKILNLAIAPIAVSLLFATTAQAKPWYLMAPEEHIVSNPRVAIRMEHGPVMGPIQFMVRSEFSSREQCEPARRQLIDRWRQLSVIRRGTWDRYGFTSPSVFIRCVPSDDQQLRRTAGNSTPTMETFVNRPSHR